MLERITLNSQINLGKPTISGTRITVEHILSLFSQGWTQEQILQEYPNITEWDIQAVFAFSAHYLKNEDIQEYA